MPSTRIRQSLRATALIWDEIYKAAIDFSTCSNYRFVQPGSVAGEVTIGTGLAASSIFPFGVMQNNPPAGCPVRVRVMGKSLVSACLGACNINFGTWITSNSAGTATAVAACGVAVARSICASATTSASTAAWGGFTEIMLLGHSDNTCVNSAS